jgi:hypothetical protein
VSEASPPEPIGLVDYPALVAQLDAALAAVPADRRLGPAATATLRQGTLSIVITADAMPREGFFAVLEVLGKYMRGFTEFKPSFNGCSVVADVYSAYQRKPARTTSATTPLPAPFKVAFAYDASGSGKITFDKDSLLFQEEVNCVLDVWRKVCVSEDPVPGAGDPAIVAFDAMEAQLARAAERDLANVSAAHRNGVPPVATYRQGTVTVELRFQTLSRESFFPVLEILGKYVRSFTELRPGIGSCAVVADVHGPVRKRGGMIKINFAFEARGGGKLTFSKDTLLLQEEINAVLEVWRLLAIKVSPDDGPTRDPRAALVQLGAVVFEPDAAFTDARIAGYEDTKRDIRETVVLPLVNTAVFTEIARLTRGAGAPSVPRAVLFEGPPGTGKTTMARIIATSADVPMVYVPVESIMSKWFGESERRLDAIFDLAGALERSIVFLDEIDAFAGSREGQIHEATRRILSVMLRQMQGLVETANVMVIGATNRAADLDPALLNRFARTISFPLPNTDERAAIIGAYARHLAPADCMQIAATCEGASGRTLSDGCGAAERLWAGQVIASGGPVTAPPVSVYLDAFRAVMRR